MNAIKKYKRKNKFILGNEMFPARSGLLNYDRWHIQTAEQGYGAEYENLGDYLAEVVNDWMLDRKGLSCTDVGETTFLASIGSVLHMGYNDCIVWGSGLLAENPGLMIRPSVKRMDIRAVRGPRTRAVLVERGYSCPEVYGDPACLMPLIVEPLHLPSSDVVLVKHHAASYLPGEEGFKQLSILTRDYKGFVRAICESRLVISSSLHGIILAEAYGVPAVLLDDYTGRSFFKYEDWYYSTGRTSFPVASSLEDALEVDPPGLPDLEPMRQRLLESFPYDIFTKSAFRGTGRGEGALHG